MLGAISTGFNIALRAKKFKRAMGEIKDVIVAVNAITASYNSMMADSKISPTEAENLAISVGRLAKEGIEAKAVIEEIIR